LRKGEEWGKYYGGEGVGEGMWGWLGQRWVEGGECFGSGRNVELEFEGGGRGGRWVVWVGRGGVDRSWRMWRGGGGGDRGNLMERWGVFGGEGRGGGG